MPHIKEYVVVFIVLSELPKTDIRGVGCQRQQTRPLVSAGILLRWHQSTNDGRPLPPVPLLPPLPTPLLLPPLLALATHRCWCQMPYFAYHRLALVFNTAEHCYHHQTPPPSPPFNPVFIVHRRQLVQCSTSLCHVGKICCLKLHQI